MVYLTRNQSTKSYFSLLEMLLAQFYTLKLQPDDIYRVMQTIFCNKNDNFHGVKPRSHLKLN